MKSITEQEKAGTIAVKSVVGKRQPLMSSPQVAKSSGVVDAVPVAIARL